MPEFLHWFFDTSGFVPRWDCGTWSDSLGYLHVISDLGVWSAYVAIPFVLGWFVIRRNDLPFRTLFWLFSAFILACGTTHLMEAIIFWWPGYRLAGVIKLFTAIVSWATVIALVPTIPKALQLRSPEALEKEIIIRKQAESALRTARDDLEKRVQDRTADLAAVNEALQTEVIQRKRAQEGSEAANRVKDEFLASLSHELRTPLNSILGWSQLLNQDPHLSDQVRQGLQVIERSANTQTRIIEDLLDISRIVSGKLCLDIQSIDLVDVVNHALTSVTAAADAKQIEIESVLDPATGMATGDPARLQQVVWNLLSNAVKFTPKGGKVRVSLDRVSSHIEITVSDTGQGIPAQFLPLVFDRFQQLDSSATRKHGGLGLGLSIVRQIVELHGGSVRASSPGEGQGATFVVSLPISALQSTATFQDGKPPQDQGQRHGTISTRLTGIRVLVVDDEQDARELIQCVLKKCEAEVQTASSAADAIELLNRFQPHVLISDIGMPERDGHDLIKQVRLEWSGRQMPAIALTAFARSEDRRRALQSGFQMHMSKPVDAAELVVSVASLARLGDSLSPA